MDYKQIKDEAAEWFAKLHNSSCTTELEEQFQHWLTVNPLHALAYEECKHVWVMNEELSQDPSIQQELTLAKLGLHTDIEKPTGSRYSAKGLRLFQYAAAVIITVTLAIASTYLPSDKYHTEIGEQRLVKLADGSSAMLNTDTVVKVYINDTQRQIRLIKGEAYFDVAHDSKRPFEVLAAGNIVRALGTEFNVALDKQEITVAVTEGQVAIETRNTLNQSPRIVAKIDPGEAITYQKNTSAPTIKAADLERITAWQMRKIYFKSDRLQDAIKEYNRYIDNNIQIIDEELKDQRITGIFNIGDLDSFLFTLEQALDAEIIRDHNRILLLKKKHWKQQQG